MISRCAWVICATLFTLAGPGAQGTGQGFSALENGLRYRCVHVPGATGVCAVLVDWEYTQVVDSIRDQLPGVRHWIAARDGGVDAPGWTDWETLIAGESEEAPAPACCCGRSQGRCGSGGEVS